MYPDLMILNGPGVLYRRGRFTFSGLLTADALNRYPWREPSCLSEPSDLFISFESLATGVRALECALSSSFRSSFVYSLRLPIVFAT